MDVEGGAGDVLGVKGLGESVDVDNGSAGCVDENHALLHLGELCRADHELGLRGLGDMHGDNVGVLQEVLKGVNLLCVAEAELLLGIEEDYLEAEGLGDNADLGSDVAVADDAEGLAPGLKAACGVLLPYAAVAVGILLRNAAEQHEVLAGDKLGYASGVGERSVEHRDAVAGRGLEIHLVGADAEAADGAELLGGVKHVIGKMSAGTDADEMNILDLLDELIVIKRALQILYLVVAGAVKRINRTRVDALKEKNLDLVFVQGITSH